MHAVKTERHDTARRQHTTNTGIRDVEVYREHAHGLFVARPFVAHPRIAYWEAHLLPELGVQLARYTLQGGRRDHDYYLDIADVTRDGDVWSVRDLYLDVVVWEGRRAEVLDTDELLAARAEGFIGEGEALAAVERAHAVLNGLSAHEYRVDAWLAEHGVALGWQEHVFA